MNCTEHRYDLKSTKICFQAFIHITHTLSENEINNRVWNNDLHVLMIVFSPETMLLIWASWSRKNNFLSCLIF